MKLLQQPIAKAAVSALAVSVAIAGIGAAAIADENSTAVKPDVKKSRFYVGVGAGVSRIHPEADCNCITVGESMSTGFSLAVGYDFNSWLTLELYGADLGSASINFLGQNVGDVNYQVYGASALGTFYRTSGASNREGLSLYARVGVGSINTQTELDYRRDHPQHVAFGVGAEYGFRNGFAVRGEVNSYDTDAQLLQVSLIKRFGGKSRQSLIPVAVSDPVTPVEVTPVQPETPVPTNVSVPAEQPPVYFKFDQDFLTTQAQGAVRNIAQQLTDTNGAILVSGHADELGSVDYNQALSVRRANAVRNLLVAEGVSANRIQTTGFGETSPAASNATAEGRALNRRVEITLQAE